MATNSQAALKPPRIPSYCHHRASGQAYIKVRGKVTYLGLYGSESSRAAYGKAITSLLADGEVPRPAAADNPLPTYRPTVRDICEKYKVHASNYYVKDGKKTPEAAIVSAACNHASQLFGDQLAESFGPLALKSVRSHLIEINLARSSINSFIKRIRRAFKWAAGEELIPASVYQSLATVEGLRRGRGEAREAAPILPVDDATVEATLPHLPEVVADMVRLQRLSGMRPAELCVLRPTDLDRSGDVWTYQPSSHKTEHHGRSRVVFLGPRAQAVLLRYLARDAMACCFRPIDSKAKRLAIQHAERRTPLSCGDRPGTNRKQKPKRRAGKQYSVDSYRRAIHRACDKAGVARWSPNRLRHSTATEVRAKFGLEAAQVVLGHAGAAVTQIYAERDLAKGVEVARQIG